jgi:hypothetical protein
MSTWFDIWDKSGNPIKGENHWFMPLLHLFSAS